MSPTLISHCEDIFVGCLLRSVETKPIPAPHRPEAYKDAKTRRCTKKKKKDKGGRDGGREQYLYLLVTSNARLFGGISGQRTDGICHRQKPHTRHTHEGVM